MTNEEMMRITTMWGYPFLYGTDQDGDIDIVHKLVGPRINVEFQEHDGTVNRRIQFGYERVYHRILFQMTGWGMIKERHKS